MHHNPGDRIGRRAFLLGAGAAAAAACSSKGDRQPTPAASADTTTPRTSTTTAAARPALPSFLSHGDRAVSKVALTFHTNGDPTVVAQLLDLLRERKVPITAFVVGVWLDANPSFAKRLLEDGHELANHTRTHPSSFRTRPPTVMTEEIRGCRDTLQRLAGTPGRWFRPSGTANGVDDPGPIVESHAAALGYHTVVGYDVDPHDYADPGATAVRVRTLATVRPGSIVSLHTGHAGTVAALPAILDGLHRATLEPVTLSTLLGAS